MIKLRNRQREEFWLNEELILRIKGEIDVAIVLIDGETIGVTETAAQVVAKIANYRAYVLQLASTGAFPEHPDLADQEV